VELEETKSKNGVGLKIFLCCGRIKEAVFHHMMGGKEKGKNQQSSLRGWMMREYDREDKKKKRNEGKSIFDIHNTTKRR